MCQGNSPGTQCPGISLELLTSAASAQHVPKFQISGKKAGAQHKSHCLYKHCRPSEALLSLRESFISGMVYRPSSRTPAKAIFASRPFQGPRVLGWPWGGLPDREFSSRSRAHCWWSETHGVFRHVTHSRAEKVCPGPHTGSGCGLRRVPRAAGLLPREQSHRQSQWQLERVFPEGQE